jgi:hypothetical protein
MGDPERMGTEHAEGDADRGSSPGTALLDEAMRLYEELSSANSEHPYRTVPLGIAMGLTLLDAGRQDDGEAVLGNAAEMGVPYAAALLSRVLERRGASPDEVEAWDRLERERPRDRLSGRPTPSRSVPCSGVSAMLRLPSAGARRRPRAAIWTA